MLSLSQRLDELPLTRERWRIVLLAGIGWMFDAMESASSRSSWSVSDATGI